MRLKLANKNIFFLPGTKNRFIHVGTIYRGVKEYICMIDVQSQAAYIEEITGGHLTRIEDDELANELEQFAQKKKVFDFQRVQRFLSAQQILGSHR